jgi:translation initiation factor 6 (eIF-6)
MKHLIGIMISLCFVNCANSSENNLVGVWVGNYKTYSYTLQINEKGDCTIIQEEVNTTLVKTTINQTSDGQKEIIIGEEGFLLSMETNKSLRILPKDKNQTDIRLLCLVAFKKVSDDPNFMEK